MNEETMHSISILSVVSEDSRQQVLAFLAARLGGKSEQEIAALLNNLPLVITRQATTANARDIASQLETMGAEVLMNPRLPENVVGTPSGLELDYERGPGRLADAAGVGEIPPGELWERRSEVGFKSAFFGTVKNALFSPDQFFLTMVSSGQKSPLLFLIVLQIPLGIIALIFSQIMIEAFLGDWLMNIFEAAEMDEIPEFGVGMTDYLLIPIQIIIGQYIATIVIHLGVLIFRGKGGFDHTFNVVAYSSVSDVFLIIPLFGPLMSFVYGFILMFMGLKRVHMMSGTRAFFVLMLPLFAVFVSAIFIAIIVGIAATN